MSKYLVFFIFMMTSPLLRAQGLCRQIHLYETVQVDFDELLQSAHGKKLMAAMPQVPEKLWKRYWNSPETNQVALEVLTDRDGRSTHFEVPPHGWMLTRTTQIDDYLFMDLVHIQIKSDTERVQVGQRAQGANSLLIKAMAGFLKAAYVAKMKSSELSTVVIRGVNIKNPMLLEFLEKNGFVRHDLHSYSREMVKTVHFDLR